MYRFHFLMMVRPVIVRMVISFKSWEMDMSDVFWIVEILCWSGCVLVICIPEQILFAYGKYIDFGFEAFLWLCSFKVLVRLSDCLFMKGVFWRRRSTYFIANLCLSMFLNIIVVFWVNCFLGGLQFYDSQQCLNLLPFCPCKAGHLDSLVWIKLMYSMAWLCGLKLTNL